MVNSNWTFHSHRWQNLRVRRHLRVSYSSHTGLRLLCVWERSCKENKGPVYGKGCKQERRMAEKNGDVPGILGSISVCFTQEIFAKMYSFVRLLWDFFLWYCSEILSAVKVLKKNQVIQSLLEILHSLDCHREECRVKGEVTAVTCWQLCFIMKLLLFVSWVRASFATADSYKMALLQYFSSKIEITYILFPWGSLLKIWNSY